jgi:Phospholipase C
MSVLPQIDTIVMLMLENRSLDNVLGWLHRDGDRRTPVHCWPPQSRPPYFDGLPDDAVCFRGTTPFRPTRGFGGLGPQRLRSPRYDPNEGIASVEVQMYGDGERSIPDPGRWGDDAPMTGFAADFPSWVAWMTSDVMGAYAPEDLPVLNGLAESFAVSDRWFGSVPTETDPNRGFSLCGTADGDEYELPRKIFHEPTLFNGLNPTADGTRPGKSWGIYWQDGGTGSFDPPGSICYTQSRFTQVDVALDAPQSSGRLAPYTELLDALRSGHDIPEFCYIEPKWGWGIGLPDGNGFIGYQGNDYHPPASVGPAEHDLNELYEALRASPQWDHMLFIVVFDEHGGLYDHVSPPSANNPDGVHSRFPVPFSYERLGPRVPAILVTPFVQPRTVFRPPDGSRTAFDHTSIIRTVLEWADADPGFIASMGRRVAAAPRFDGVLAPRPVQLDAPRGFVPCAVDENLALGPQNLVFDASGLGLEDHRIATAASSTLEDYVAALRERADLKRSRPSP